MKMRLSDTVISFFLSLFLSLSRAHARNSTVYDDETASKLGDVPAVQPANFQIGQPVTQHQTERSHSKDLVAKVVQNEVSQESHHNEGYIPERSETLENYTVALYQINDDQFIMIQSIVYCFM